MLPGKNATVTIEHLTQGRDAHGAATDGAADQTFTEDAIIERPSRGNLWKITVSGNYGSIAQAPGEWRITHIEADRKYAALKASHRPPIERIGESEHTLIFAEQFGEVEYGEVPI